MGSQESLRVNLADTMRSRASADRRRAVLALLFVALTALSCAVLLGAAALVPAPTAALPFAVIVCIACPMVVTLQVPRAIAALRRHRKMDSRALAELRRSLDQLPETKHPLGL